MRAARKKNKNDTVCREKIPKYNRRDAGVHEHRKRVLFERSSQFLLKSHGRTSAYAYDHKPQSLEQTHWHEPTPCQQPLPSSTCHFRKNVIQLGTEWIHPTKAGAAAAENFTYTALAKWLSCNKIAVNPRIFRIYNGLS